MIEFKFFVKLTLSALVFLALTYFIIRRAGIKSNLARCFWGFGFLLALVSSLVGVCGAIWTW